VFVAAWGANRPGLKARNNSPVSADMHVPFLVGVFKFDSEPHLSFEQVYAVDS